MKNLSLLDSIINISKDAGDSILKIYNHESMSKDVVYKDDNSPLTLADKASHNTICEGLKQLTPDIPILSEEGTSISYNERKNWEKFWLIDPLDGTKEFIKRNGEFTVNIALINKDKPILGVVFAPVINILWYGTTEFGSFKVQNNETKKIKIKSSVISKNEVVKIVSSRSHANNPKLESYLNQFSIYEIVKMGSSIKICLVADGTAHYYPRFGPTMEWDTAAAHAVVKYAGGEILKMGSDFEISYNKENLLNPEFLVN